MTVREFIEQCRIDTWQHIVVKCGKEVLGGGFKEKILRRYGAMIIHSVWCVNSCIYIKVE